MPKTARQIIDNGLNKLGMSNLIDKVIRPIRETYSSKGEKDKVALLDKLQWNFLQNLMKDDEEDISKALENSSEFDAFLHNPFDGEKTGYEVLTENMTPEIKEDFDACLRDLNNIYELDMEIDSIKGITPAKSAVIQTNINNIEKEINGKADVPVIPFSKAA